MIRKATASDFNFIYELYMHPHVNTFLLYELTDRDFFLKIFNDLLAGELLFVFEETGISKGMCKLVPQKHRNAHIVYLGGVAIHPFYNEMGNGTKMMQDIISYAKQKGFLRIELSVASINEKAIRLYEKVGFVKEGVLKKFTYLKSEDRFLDEEMMAYLIE